MQEIVGKLFL